MENSLDLKIEISRRILFKEVKGWTCKVFTTTVFSAVHCVSAFKQCTLYGRWPRGKSLRPQPVFRSKGEVGEVKLWRNSFSVMEAVSCKQILKVIWFHVVFFLFEKTYIPTWKFLIYYIYLFSVCSIVFLTSEAAWPDLGRFEVGTKIQRFDQSHS